ncbi:hypothetical protein BDV97DRAFT_176888 [Delphinella strobiligena]|nr:hypothetical protein BDV97DRAFT_176888 [Delphinella strobiligena]
MLRRPHTEAITWFSSSSSLNGLLFHLEQKALISAPAYISPEENAPHVNDDAVPYYLSWKHTDLHTRLCLLLRHCFPPQLLQSGPEDGQEDHNASLGDDSKDGRDVDTPDDNQAPAEQDKAVAPDGFGNKDTDRQSEVDASGDEHINEEQVEITADNQAPAADDKAAAPSETDNGDDQPEAPTVTLNPAIPPDYAARLAPLRPANVRDYTRLQDNLSDTVDPGEQILASFNHCKSLEDYRRDKQAFLAAARGEKKTVEEWRVWAVNGGGFGGRNCRDGRARQWAKTFHAMGWVELKEE